MNLNPSKELNTTLIEELYEGKVTKGSIECWVPKIQIIPCKNLQL